jgi:hypothetical protein
MNYQKIYSQIIERAKNRHLEGYKEKHHILPKCLGGSNDKDNLVGLTAREHFLCHMLLCEIYPDKGKLRQALWLMSINPKYKNTKITSRMYEHIKSNFRHTEESKQKMRHPRPGLGEKISKARTGKKQPNISKAKLGKPTNKKGKPDGPKHTDESKKKISEKKREELSEIIKERAIAYSNFIGPLVVGKPTKPTSANTFNSIFFQPSKPSSPGCAYSGTC